MAKSKKAAEVVIEELRAADLYFRRGPLAVVVHVRVWDAERFLGAEMERGRSAPDAKDRYKIVLATRAEYMRSIRR
jgi:hypothetical protein